MKLPVVVLTPVKNEEWIIEKFLEVTSKVADRIILADQGSTDETISIARRFKKVVIIRNDNSEYDEGFRQRLLIGKARELYPGIKLMLALDADEIITFDSISSKAWEVIDRSPPGTGFTFEKPDILSPISKCLRRSEYFRLGYLDDDAVHQGTKVHSPRLPFSRNLVNIDGIKFMHFALARPIAYWSRQRLYSVIENIQSTSPFYHRLLKYSRQLNDRNHEMESSATPSIWLQGWQELGISFAAIDSNEQNQYNREVYDAFVRYGTSKFFLDDIWDVDWSQFYSRDSAQAIGTEFDPPPFHFRALLKSTLMALRLYKKLKRS
jgi:glycosyltransferase involved in cell wall biosynthesis